MHMKRAPTRKHKHFRYLCHINLQFTISTTATRPLSHTTIFMRATICLIFINAVCVRSQRRFFPSLKSLVCTHTHIQRRQFGHNMPFPTPIALSLHRSCSFSRSLSLSPSACTRSHRASTCLHDTPKLNTWYSAFFLSVPRFLECHRKLVDK